MRTYAIVGTGAVGGYYGACLQRGGLDVHFLLRSDYEAVKTQGIKVDSPKGNFHLPHVKAYARAADMPRCDVVVLAWKTTHNRALPETLPRLVKPGGFVLVLQNGLEPEREAAPHAGGAHVLGGLCFLSSRKVGPGHVLHQDYGTITLAAYPGVSGGAGGAVGSGGPDGAAAVPEEVTAGLRGIAEDLGRGGVDTRILADWRAARWRKLVWNVPFNGLCALHGLDTSALLARPELRERARALMEEVLAGAAREGHVLPLDFADRMLADTEKMVPYEPSMKLDRDAGRPMELAAIYERTIEAIRKAGGKAPQMEALLRELRMI